MVVSVTVKGEAGLRQVSAMETNNNESLYACRKFLYCYQNRDLGEIILGQVWKIPDLLTRR